MGILLRIFQYEQFFVIYSINWKVNPNEICLLISLSLIKSLHLIFMLRLSEDLSANEEHLEASHISELAEAVKNQSSMKKR